MKYIKKVLCGLLLTAMLSTYALAATQNASNNVAAANLLTGTTLASGVVNSSLTSVGTLVNLTVTNPISGSVTGAAGSVAANALTGTTLAAGVTGSSLTGVGTLVAGATGAGFTVNVGTSTISGVLPAVNGGAGTISGALKANGSGTVSQAACGDLSNATSACSTTIGTSGSTIGLNNGNNTLSGTNAVTGVMTISNNDLTLLGSSTGKTTLNSGLSSSSNNTLTLPTEASDTLVDLTGSQNLTNKTTTTQAARDNSTKLASTAYTDAAASTISQNSQSVNYTLVLSDAGLQILHPASDANARTFTIPANASVAYATGTAVTFINLTSQVVTIAITTDTMYLSPSGSTGSRSLAQYGVATAVKVDSTHWIISGAGLT